MIANPIEKSHQILRITFPVIFPLAKNVHTNFNATWLEIWQRGKDSKGKLTFANLKKVFICDHMNTSLAGLYMTEKALNFPFLSFTVNSSLFIDYRISALHLLYSRPLTSLVNLTHLCRLEVGPVVPTAAEWTRPLSSQIELFYLEFSKHTLHFPTLLQAELVWKLYSSFKTQLQFLISASFLCLSSVSGLIDMLLSLWTLTRLASEAERVCWRACITTMVVFFICDFSLFQLHREFKK